MHAHVGEVPEAVQEYEFTKHLQSGAFGAVWAAVDSTGRRVAVKLQRRHTFMIEHEAAMLAKLGEHDHIVPYHTHSVESLQAALVTELCDGDLLDLISRKRRLRPADAAPIFQQIVVAVAHMHASGIAHCDLKPENVLMKADGKACVTDFGASSADSIFTARNLGSAQYLCPELLNWHEGDVVDFRAGDVWSLGVVFFTMLAGYQPWGQPTTSDIHFSQFAAGTLRFPSHFSRSLTEFLLAMLDLSPRRRLTAAQILEHPYLRSHIGADALKAPPSPTASLVQTLSLSPPPTVAAPSTLVPAPAMEVNTQDVEVEETKASVPCAASSNSPTSFGDLLPSPKASLRTSAEKLKSAAQKANFHGLMVTPIKPVVCNPQVDIDIEMVDSDDNLVQVTPLPTSRRRVKHEAGRPRSSSMPMPDVTSSVFPFIESR